MLFLVVVAVFGRAAALIYAPSFLVLFHDFITPLGAFSFLSQLCLQGSLSTQGGTDGTRRTYKAKAPG